MTEIILTVRVHNFMVADTVNGSLIGEGHQQGREWRRPEQAVIEVRPDLRTDGGAAGIIVRCLGTQPYQCSAWFWQVVGDKG